MNRTTFYSKVRQSLFYGKLSQGQVDGMESILNEWVIGKYCDTRKLAYILATCYHETAMTMQPIEEYGRGKGRDYGKKLKMGGGAGKRIPYSKPDKLYYGRGFVQLTWYENYEKMGNLLGIDLLNNPEWALNNTIAVMIMFEGMFTGNSYKGDFTGRHLDQFFNDTTEDWVGARKIINGTDRAVPIANIAKKFYTALI